MLKKICQNLDKWLAETNAHRAKEGLILFHKMELKVLGQIALLEAKIDLHLAATMDVDAYLKCEYEVQQKFAELLKAENLLLDPDSKLIWMPSETEYTNFYSGKFVEAFLANAEYVLLSKAIKAPQKNKNIIAEYLAKNPSKLFLNLAKKYNLDLASFL